MNLYGSVFNFSLFSQVVIINKNWFPVTWLNKINKYVHMSDLPLALGLKLMQLLI